QAELFRDVRQTWSATLQPLADAFVQRFGHWLARATYPVRAGTHGNTAFALRLALEYAAAAKDDDFAALLRATSLRWYAQDADCQCWEPSGEVFLSPALVEAQCMAAALERNQFVPWFARFLPHLAQQEPACLFQPVHVCDRSDGRIVHLDGLNLSRAWSWRQIASLLVPASPVQSPAAGAPRRHISSSLPAISGQY